MHMYVATIAFKCHELKSLSIVQYTGFQSLAFLLAHCKHSKTWLETRSLQTEKTSPLRCFDHDPGLQWPDIMQGDFNVLRMPLVLNEPYFNPSSYLVRKSAAFIQRRHFILFSLLLTCGIYCRYFCEWQSPVVRDCHIGLSTVKLSKYKSASACLAPVYSDLHDYLL